MFRFHLIFFALVASAAAGEVRLTLESAPVYALQHNPTLAAARLRIQEASGRLQQSGRLSNPELELDLTRHTTGREGSASIGFMQRFPVTARLRHAQAVTRAELAAAEAEVRDAERKLAAEVSAAAARLLALSGERDLRTKQLENSRELSGFLSKRTETGEASVVDASQVELESRLNQIELLQLTANEAVMIGELRPLLGVANENRITISGSLAEPKPLPAASTVTARSDILAAQARAQAAQSVILEQRARRWEDVGVTASYTRDRVMDEPNPIETEQIIGLRLSLPLPLWNNNSGRIREAQAAAARAEKEVAATKLTANAEVSAALATMRVYSQLVAELDQQVLPTAERIEAQLRSSYTNGQSPLTEVLRARTRLLEIKRQRLDALRDYHLARIRYSAATSRSTPLAKVSK